MGRRPYVPNWPRGVRRGVRRSFLDFGVKVASAAERRQDFVMWAAVAVMTLAGVQQSKVEAGAGLTWWFIVAGVLFTLTMLTAAFGPDLFGRGRGGASHAPSSAG